MKRRVIIIMAWIVVFAAFTGCLFISTASAEGPKALDAFACDGGLVVLMEDGTLRAVPLEEIENEYDYGLEAFEALVQEWKGIIQLRRCDMVVAGLRADGTVKAYTPEVSVFVDGEVNEYGKVCEEYVREIESWDHIVDLYGSYHLIAGLRDDGTVVTTGEDDSLWYESEDPGMFETIESWRNVRMLNIGVCAAGAYAAALHSDGTVSCTGVYDVGWSGRNDHVIDLDCSGWGLIALKDDGTCVVNGEDSGYSIVTDTWTDLRQVGCGDTLAVGLRNDGTIFATRDDLSNDFFALRDIVRIDCSTYSTICAYRKDGTVEVFEYSGDTGNEEVRKWTDIENILVAYPVIVGLKTDGTLISTVGEIVLS